MNNLNIQDRFNKELPADIDKNNTRRQVKEACFSFVQPLIPSKPTLLHASEEMLNEIGLKSEDKNSKEFLEIFSGTRPLEDSQSYAMCYGGHQFGHWAGQLGDGRAINLAEVEHQGKTWALQLKGAGPTPYSRQADGLAVLRSSIREHLCSEAMYHLGVPTTRSLSLMLTGDQVLRDVMYNGNAAYEKGAVVCRVSPSFIRFGNFEIFAARKDIINLKKLADYTIKHHFPEIKEEGKAAYIDFFKSVAQRNLKMVIEWQRVGFVHGVMNTDNMSILGLTIDYGPYGWLEPYDPNWTPNTTDRTNKRYRFGQQPSVVLWNLYQLANALYPLVEEIKPFEETLDQFKLDFAEQYVKMMRAKLGLTIALKEDQLIIEGLFANLEKSETDMTIFFRLLAKLNKEENAEAGFKKVQDAFYQLEEIKGSIKEEWLKWFGLYLERLNLESNSDEERKLQMNLVNPKYVLRNYMAQIAIDAADEKNYSIIEELHNLLKLPYDEQVDKEKWFSKRPEWARTKVGCSMLSCSS